MAKQFYSNSLPRELFIIGDTAGRELSGILSRAINNLQAELVQSHGHALVWWGISHSLPENEGWALMQSHIEYYHGSLKDQGIAWTFEETEAAVRLIWSRFIEGRGPEGQSLMSVISTINENLVGDPSRSLLIMPNLLVFLEEVIHTVRETIDRLSIPIDSDGFQEKFPLELENVAHLSQSDIHKHLALLSEYPEPKTLIEFRRRALLREALMARLPRKPGTPQRGAANLRQESYSPAHPKIVNQPGSNFAIAGLILGILSIFTFFVGGFPIAAIIFSSIGITKSKERGGKGKSASVVGLVLGLIFFFLHVFIRIMAATSS